jgi:hypothetical protein
MSARKMLQHVALSRTGHARHNATSRAGGRASFVGGGAPHGMLQRSTTYCNTVRRSRRARLCLRLPCRRSHACHADSDAPRSLRALMRATKCDTRNSQRSTAGGLTRLGLTRLGSARLGSARLGSARLGSARLGSARLGLRWIGSQLRRVRWQRRVCRRSHLGARGRRTRRSCGRRSRAARLDLRRVRTARSTDATRPAVVSDCSGSRCASTLCVPSLRRRRRRRRRCSAVSDDSHHIVVAPERISGLAWPGATRMRSRVRRALLRS